MIKRDQMKINFVEKGDKNSDLRFWMNKTPQERVDAVEFLRTQYYALSGYSSIPRFIPSLLIREAHK
jgi:hypothetical protein